MRKIIVFISVLFSFVACDLNDLEPAQTKAFMKYFGEDGNTVGIDLLNLEDGYLLLGNNQSREDITSALLIKVDLSGNLIWANQFDNISGSAIANTSEGYFIIGDSIDNSNPLNTRMSLIKTDLQGGNPRYTSLGEANIPYHGTGITISSANEVVVCGYSGNNQTFLYGYNQNIDPTWTLRKWPPVGVNPIVSSNTLLENSNGDFVWTTLVNTGIDTYELHALAVARDDGSPKDYQELLENLTVSADMGGFNATSTGGVLVQSIDNPSAIAMATYSNFVESSSALITENGNKLYAHAVLQSGGNFVVLGSTDKHDGTTPRSDLDFYITKVGIDGVVSATNGFTSIIGGTGDETGAAIVPADDGGFVFLGTMKNTNEVEMMVLVKVNSKGELIN